MTLDADALATLVALGLPGEGLSLDDLDGVCFDDAEAAGADVSRRFRIVVKRKP